MGGITDYIFGKPDKLKKIATGTPQQQQFHQGMLDQAQQLQGGGLQDALNYWQNLIQPGGQGFEQFSQPYMQQFQEQMLPRIAEQFAGAGALSSSGFGQAIGGAASGLQSQLAKLFSDLQGNAAQSLTGQYNQMAQQGLNYQPFAYQQKQGSSGFLGPLATGLGFALGGPLGGAAGAGISSLFSRNKSSGSQTSGLAGNSASLAGLMNLLGGQ